MNAAYVARLGFESELRKLGFGPPVIPLINAPDPNKDKPGFTSGKMLGRVGGELSTSFSDLIKDKVNNIQNSPAIKPSLSTNAPAFNEDSDSIRSATSRNTFKAITPLKGLSSLTGIGTAPDVIPREADSAFDPFRRTEENVKQWRIQNKSKGLPAWYAGTLDKAREYDQNTFQPTSYNIEGRRAGLLSSPKGMQTLNSTVNDIAQDKTKGFIGAGVDADGKLTAKLTPQNIQWGNLPWGKILAGGGALLMLPALMSLLRPKKDKEKQIVNNYYTQPGVQAFAKA